MTDLAYILATVVLFAAIAVVARRFGDRGEVPAHVPLASHVPAPADGRDS